MNRTQKSALVNTIVITLCMTFFLILLFELIFFKKIYFHLHLFFALLIVPSAVIGFPFIFTKQSKRSVESDEFDKLIQLKAVLISCLSGWFLLAVACLACRFAVGLDGTISIWIMTLINMSVCMLAVLIFSISILVQYYISGRSKGEES